MKRVPVFDIGDTLSPARKFSIQFFDEELQEQGLENPPKYPYEEFNEMDVESIESWFDEAEIDADAKKLVEKYKEAKKQKLKDLEIFEMLRKIQEEIGKPGIISDNKVAAKKFYKEIFEEENIGIDGFVVSEEIGVKKPDPEIFKEFVERRGVEGKECIYFGNNISRDSACEKVGMTFILVEQFKVFGEDWEGRKISELNFENVRKEVERQ
ncbi:MAG: hypothetical protein BRC27_00885 [Nanohaloarchaea archaeon SW_10_44_10]|nr:MAG: hypothetical protein BRC27_00885 [Nanohaloarchaea archaeon SW_10_44_10]